jgi:hypothetical protein
MYGEFLGKAEVVEEVAAEAVAAEEVAAEEVAAEEVAAEEVAAEEVAAEEVAAEEVVVVVMVGGARGQDPSPPISVWSNRVLGAERETTWQRVEPAIGILPIFAR